MPLFVPHHIFDRILRIRPYILHSVLLIKILKKTESKTLPPSRIIVTFPRKHYLFKPQQMKIFQCPSFFLFIILCFSCQTSQKNILIEGRISGEIPETIEYTDPIHGICHWGFKKHVSPDSMGHFRIEIPSEEAIFIKIRPVGGTSGTLIAEPGKIYNILFDFQENQESFTVTDPISTVHEMYDQLPDPPHIQVGASEFFPDTIAAEIQSTIEERKNDEISAFQDLYSKGEISEEVFSLLKSDRECYYDAVTANVAFIKERRVMQGDAS